jgi:hypothetical protein
MRLARGRAAAIIAAPSAAAIVPAATVGPVLDRTSTATASPGGLDRRGGHHCRKSRAYCRRFGLYLNQYHCHRSPCNRRDIRRHRRHGH